MSNPLWFDPSLCLIGGNWISSQDTLQLINPGPLLADPGLWGGFVVAGVFIAGAIWLRRYRFET